MVVGCRSSLPVLQQALHDSHTAGVTADDRITRPRLQRQSIKRARVPDIRTSTLRVES
jgi:hypothetical protein